MAALRAGTLAEVELAVVVLTPLAVFEAAGALPAAAVQLRRSRIAAARLVELLPTEQPTPPSPRTSAHAPTPADRAATATAALFMNDPTAHPGPAASVDPSASVGTAASGEALLRLDGVAAGWPGAALAAVAGVDLVLRPGVAVAIVGPSGIGKTTLLMTAAGLLPACAGKVSATADALFVAEDGHVFATTVLENLRVARGDVTADEAGAALAAVGLGAWLAALPDGLDMPLREGATTVSGGERRRLLVARALLAPARVLLVDEPAEHLDADAADAVIAALVHHARTSGRALVVATHRLTAAEIADEVLLLGHVPAADPPPSEQGDTPTTRPAAPAGRHADQLRAPGRGPAQILARGTHPALLRIAPDYAWATDRERGTVGP
jgi:ATP-binding cassette subfamily C protein CydC